MCLNLLWLMCCSVLLLMLVDDDCFLVGIWVGDDEV